MYTVCICVTGMKIYCTSLRAIKSLEPHSYLNRKMSHLLLILCRIILFGVIN